MKPPDIGIKEQAMATNYTSSSNPGAAKMGDVLDALSSGIAKTAANEPKFEPQHLVPEVPVFATERVCDFGRVTRL